MKELSNEELVERYCNSCIACDQAESTEEDCYPENFRQQKELERRLSEGQRAIEENERWRTALDITEAALGISGLYASKDIQVEQLSQQLEDAQCCGNCKLFPQLDTICNGKSGWYRYCPSHTPDKLSRKERSE